MLTKVCTTCGVEKCVGEFFKHKLCKYGVRAECKCCASEQAKADYQANKDVVLEQRKVYYEANKDVVLERNKVYKQTNKEAIAKQAKAYKQANKEAIAERMKVYQQANREAIAERMKVYQQANPHIVNANSAKRKASKLQATPAWADLEAIKGMYELATLFNRTGMNLHVDHIVPLISNRVCGLHCEANLQLLSASDNISKGNRHWPDM